MGFEWCGHYSPVELMGLENCGPHTPQWSLWNLSEREEDVNIDFTICHFLICLSIFNILAKIYFMYILYTTSQSCKIHVFVTYILNIINY